MFVTVFFEQDFIFHVLAERGDNTKVLTNSNYYYRWLCVNTVLELLKRGTLLIYSQSVKWFTLQTGLT